jgi:dipeptidyl aminopeptidase/acylaminoacyl peptidase
MQKHLTTLTLLIVLSALASIPALGQEVSPYTVTDFLGMTFFPEIEVSPDARHVAFITAKDNFATDRKEATVWKIDLDAQGRKIGMERVAGEPGQYSSPKWSSDGRYLAFQSLRSNSRADLIVFDIEINRSFRLTTEKKFINGISAFDWSADGRRIYFVVNDVPPPQEAKAVSFPEPTEPDDHSTFYRLAAADFGRKDPQLVAAINDTAAEFALSPDEKTIAFRPGRALFLLDTTGKQAVRRLTPPFPCLDPGMKWIPKGLVIQGCGGMKDGRMVRTQRRIYWVDPANGHMEQLAPDFTGELWAQGGTPEGGVLAIGNISTKWGIYYIDPLTRKAQEVESSLGAVRRLSVATNGNLAAFSTVNNPELYIASGINRMSSATKMTDFNAKLSQMPKPEVETVRWNNNEGDVIEGVLYYPPEKKGAKNLPFILYIHGGPWTARTESFYVPLGVKAVDEAALLASRGYLVLMPNYRGSTGRGDAFLQALNGYPCSRPSTDVLTGVDYVVAKGWADPERLGVMGSSYGGQITNCVIGLTNRFKAAASTSGFWNLISAFEITNGKPPWKDMKMYWEESAISRAANIKTPTIITIGAADERVNPEQAKEQKRALDWLEVPNELLMFPGEGHNFSKPSNQRIRLEAELAWLDHYILGKPLPKPK